MHFTRPVFAALAAALMTIGAHAQSDGGTASQTMPAMPGMNMPGMMMPGMSMPAMDPVMMGMMALDPDHMRMGSGTSWHPDSTPTSAFTKQAGAWSVMTHGAAWLTYNHTDSPRGYDAVRSQNWVMFMGQRSEAGGALMLRSMLSLEPATIGGAGYPLLFQTGESWHGKPLLDSQHPHDLFMEVAADYSHPLTSNLAGARWNVYLAPVGEPALGPEAFMHRQSAFEDPLAPISHHWQDATHISWGVATAGISSRAWKLEGSVFNGHEPNENRYFPDPIKFNSQSARLWYVPNQDWAFQVSLGHINHPEATETGNVDRTTASAEYNRPLADGNLAMTAVWGRNHEDAGNSNSYLFEADWNYNTKNYLFTRLETVKKHGLFPADDPRSEDFYNIGAYTLGYSRDVAEAHGLVTALGIEGLAFSKPSSLDEAYGRRPYSVYVFARVRPKQKPMMGGMADMDMSMPTRSTP